MYHQADLQRAGYLDGAYYPGEASSTATEQGYSDLFRGGNNGWETPEPFTEQPGRTIAAEDHGPRDSTDESTNPGQEHQDGYVVEPPSKFRPGQVFRVIWTEPKRFKVKTPQNGPIQDGLSSNRQFSQGIRRFIVVANDEGHCTCVPIFTYHRQGCKKKGVKPLNHGIVYQIGKSPLTLPEEPQLGFEPVPVHLYHKRWEELVKESRVDYSKLVAVKHSLPVFFIGCVNPEDFMNIVSPAVDTCWERKVKRIP